MGPCLRQSVGFSSPADGGDWDIYEEKGFHIFIVCNNSALFDHLHIVRLALWKLPFDVQDNFK